MPAKEISFRKAMIDAFARQDFETNGQGAFIASPEVEILVQPGRTASTSQVSISVGFWIFAIGPTAPTTVAGRHVHGGLHSLVPQAGDAEAAFARRADDWLDTLDRVAIISRTRLGVLLTLADLRLAWRAGAFAKCVVRRDARDVLSPLK